MCSRGHFLLALVACLQACCPLEQLPGLGPPAPTPGLALTVGGGTGGSMEVDASEAQHPQQQPAGQQTPGAALLAAHPAHAAGTLSAAPASAVHATPAEAAGTVRSLWPTPATQARHQVSEQLLQVAAGLDGTPAEQLLAKAHQVRVLQAWSAASWEPALCSLLSRRCVCPALPLWVLYSKISPPLLAFLPDFTGLQ